MCGIAGLVRFDGRPVLETDVRSMCRVMVHRGPDEEGVFLGAGVGMGMRRLSIIDLAGGQQPLSNEDGSVWVVFNGEIYNYAELRQMLTRRGHVLRTESDTETIVHLYEDFGDECVDYLRGMFAFAIWDTCSRQLLLARDRLGIKPLYYAELDGGIAFASELKPILQLPEVSRNLDWEALGHLFTFLATPASQSIVDGVRKLEPGRIATASAGRPLRIDRYWDVNFTPDERASEGDLADELQALLRDAVRIHRISDVPLGAFLSGGIDSAQSSRHGQAVRQGEDVSIASPRPSTTSWRTLDAWQKRSARSITSWCCDPMSCRLPKTSPGIWTSPSAIRPRFRPTWCRSSRPSTSPSC
jgi:asparagine synthase (glutamine-hydrolysing)